MRSLLLAIALIFSFAAVITNAANVPKGLLIAGFVVVAMTFLVQTGLHIRRATADGVSSSRARSVARMRNSAGAGTPSLGLPASVGSSAPEGRVA